MINSRKKGFTLVELVIVIAVVAILAAVLIPTFSSLVKKANVAHDTAVAKNMNTALVEYTALNGKPENFDEVLEAIEEAGYVLANLNAKAGGNLYGWDAKNNQIVYINEKGETIYKNVDFIKSDVKFVVTNVASTPDWADNSSIVDMSKPEGPKAFKGALEAGISVELTSNMEIAEVIRVSGNVSIKLNNNKLSAPETTRPFNMSNDSVLTIDADNDDEIVCGMYGLVNIDSGVSATVILNGGKYSADTDNGSFIKVRPGAKDVNITLNNVTYVDSSDDGFVLNKFNYNGTMNLTINGGTFTANAGFQVVNGTIEGATFNTKAYAFEITGNTTIKNCTINVGSATVSSAPAAAVAVSNGGTATVTGCTITCNGTPSVYAVYSTGGTINRSNNTVSGTYDSEYVEYK